MRKGARPGHALADSGCSVAGAGCIAVTLTKPCVVRAMLGHDLEIQLAEIELSDEAFAVEALVCVPVPGIGTPPLVRNVVGADPTMA